VLLAVLLLLVLKCRNDVTIYPTGSQVIQGSQLLTDGQNFFLHVPNHIDLPPNTTIQIENPPPTLTISHQQLVAAEQQNLLNNPTPSTSAPAE